MKRAVKYCGGCNPRYDRVALVHRLEEKFGEKIPAANYEEVYDELYVICGCTSRCTDLSGYMAKSIVVWDGLDSYQRIEM